VAPADLLAQQVADAARKIARYPTRTMRNAKRLLWRNRDDIAAALEAERQGFVELIASARGGVERFLANFSDYPEGE
jgi:enoyl-CoA hydratase/carnithine racemase